MNKQIKIGGVIYGILHCIILCGMESESRNPWMDENVAEMQKANYEIIGAQVYKKLSVMQFIDKKTKNFSNKKITSYEEAVIENDEFNVLIQKSKEKMNEAVGVRITFDLIGQYNKKFLALEIGFTRKGLSDLENQIKENQYFFPYEKYINMPEIYTIKNVAAVSINNEKLFNKAKRFNKNNGTFEEEKEKLIKAMEIFEHFYKEIKLLYIIQVLYGTLPLSIKYLNAIDATERRLFAYIQPSFKNIVKNWNKLNEAEQKEFIALVIDFSNSQEVTLLIQKMHIINTMLSTN